MDSLKEGSKTLVRKLSFGRQRKKDAAPPAPPSAGPSAAAPPAAPPPAEPAPSTAKSVKAVVTRRTLSFSRAARRNKAPTSAPAAGGGAPSSGGGGAPKPAPTSGRRLGAGLKLTGAAAAKSGAAKTQTVLLKRTNSWSRGHRQTGRAAAAKREDAARAFAKAAPALQAALAPPLRAKLATVCKPMRDAAADVAVDRALPAPLPHMCYTHEGGEGGHDKENQDTYFVAHPSPQVAIYAVFDGHGRMFGRLAAQVSAAVVKSFLCAHWRFLLDNPGEAMRQAFSEAHAAVLRAMLRADPTLRVQENAQGRFLLRWMECEDDDGNPSHKWDAVDGGTTATVVAVIRGKTLIAAGVGDSSGLLLGNAPGGPSGAHELLLEEHSPTNLAEHVRMRALPSGPQLKWVYDCPDFEEFNIFSDTGPGGAARLDDDNLKTADEHGVMIKNSREDRFTLLVIPEEELDLPALAATPAPQGAAQKTLVEEQAITMSRSLGDFYAHRHGVICEPEVRALPIASIAQRGWKDTLMLLASDGVWDLWGFDEVSTELVSPTNGNTVAMKQRADKFFEATRAKGNEYFGESADNLTGVLVNLAPVKKPSLARPAPSAAPVETIKLKPVGQRL
jgi:serine/threonine protein phosphatase PrpC